MPIVFSSIFPLIVPDYQVDLYDAETGQTATLKVTAVASAPEPTTWALMLEGFGALCGALRARRRQVPAAL